MNSGVQHGAGTYHDVTVDIFDYKIDYVLDRSVMVQLLGAGGIVVCRVSLDCGDQCWVGIVYVVCVPGES